MLKDDASEGGLTNECGKPKVYWRRGHRYVRVQIEITEKQWSWLHGTDEECRIGFSGHIRFAICQYRARIEQQKVELIKRLSRKTVGNPRKGG
jgi:hypothetical protein